MSTDNTNVSDETDVSGSTNDKSDTTGSDNNQDAKKSDVQPEKKFSQDDLNNIIKQKQAEWKTKYKSEFEKTLEGKLVLTEEDKDKLIKEAVEAAIKQESLKSVRAKIKEEYGLDDYKVGKLEGDDETALREDAEKTYGKPKKEAPRINPGTRREEQDENESRNEWLKKGIKRKRDWLD